LLTLSRQMAQIVMSEVAYIILLGLLLLSFIFRVS